MESKGLVTAVTGKEVRVRLYKETACEHCNTCSAEKKFVREFTLVSDEDIKPGDVVTLEIAGNTLVKASLILYALPVVFMFSGYYVGSQTLGLPEGKSIGLSFLFLLVSFLLIWFYDRVFRGVTDQDIRITDISRNPG
ncbi:MAG: SoxR reducing system RseC family protein [Fusobacteriaceae bacterium]|jgi:sigma-E factor negative regulatory protein RseC|nr:SoxR reducing system RseC family protein [Fusobacteriaceae bacterium]